MRSISSGTLSTDPADGHPVICQNSQLRPAIANLVGDVERPAGETCRVEGLAAEDLPDTVVEFGPGFARVHVLFFAPDDLAQIGFGEKAHRRAGAVVEISGLGDELLTRLFDEGDVSRGAKEGIPQLLRREALERIVEGECVQEDGAGNVDRVGRQAAVILGIDLLGQGLLFPSRRR